MSTNSQNIFKYTLKIALVYVIGVLLPFFFFRNLYIRRECIFVLNDFIYIFFLLFFHVIIEEILFRWTIYKFLYKLLGDIEKKSIRITLASFVQAILFSLLHFKNNEVIKANNKFFILLIYFIAGLFFSYLYISSDSIVIPISLHFLNNLLSTFVFSSLDSSFSISIFYINIHADDIRMILITSIPIILSSVYVRMNKLVK